MEMPSKLNRRKSEDTWAAVTSWKKTEMTEKNNKTGKQKTKEKFLAVSTESKNVYSPAELKVQAREQEKARISRE